LGVVKGAEFWQLEIKKGTWELKEETRNKLI